MTLKWYTCVMNDDERKERNREAARRYREKNRETIKARRAERTPEQRQADRDYHREYMREWAAKNPDRTQAIATRSYDRNRAAQYAVRRAELDALKNRPCSDCKVQYPPYVMQFDHRIPSEKLFPIDVAAMRRARDKLAAEIAKCDLVCANCHAERTHQQRLAGYKFGGPARTRPREQVA